MTHRPHGRRQRATEGHRNQPARPPAPPTAATAAPRAPRLSTHLAAKIAGQLPSDATTAARFALVELVSYMRSPDFTAYPSIETLAARVNCAEDTLRKALRWLEEHDLIAGDPPREQRKGGRAATVRWRVGSGFDVYAGLASDHETPQPLERFPSIKTPEPPRGLADETPDKLPRNPLETPQRLGGRLELVVRSTSSRVVSACAGTAGRRGKPPDATPGASVGSPLPAEPKPARPVTTSSDAYLVRMAYPGRLGGCSLEAIDDALAADQKTPGAWSIQRLCSAARLVDHRTTESAADWIRRRGYLEHAAAIDRPADATARRPQRPRLVGSDDGPPAGPTDVAPLPTPRAAPAAPGPAPSTKVQADRLFRRLTEAGLVTAEQLAYVSERSRTQPDPDRYRLAQAQRVEAGESIDVPADWLAALERAKARRLEDLKRDAGKAAGGIPAQAG